MRHAHLLFLLTALYSKEVFAQEELVEDFHLAVSIIAESDNQNENKRADQANQVIAEQARTKDITVIGIDTFFTEITARSERKDCFARTGCLHRTAIRKNVTRILYGTVQLSGPASSQVLTLRFHLLNAIENREEKSWEWSCPNATSKPDQFKVKLDEIAAEIREVVTADPRRWHDKKADELAELEELASRPISPKPQTSATPPKKPQFPYLRITGFSLLGVGLVISGIGGYELSESYSAGAKYEKATTQIEAKRYESQSRDAYSKAKTLFFVGGTTAVLGIAVLTVDFLGLLKVKSDTSLVFTPDGFFLATFSF